MTPNPLLKVLTHIEQLIKPDSKAEKVCCPGIDPTIAERIKWANDHAPGRGVSDEMKAHYAARGEDEMGRPPLPDGVEYETKVHAQETKSPNAVKGTYRAQFMQGKELEYEATVKAFREMEDKTSSDRVSALDYCRRFAHFAWDRVTSDVRIMTDSCRQRWCPMCAGQKAKYAKESTLRYIRDLKKPRFLTLTLRNEPGDLKPQIEFLQDCFKRLRQKAYWKRNVTGGIWFLQVKRGANSGYWHPHLHILLDGNYMESGDISALWDLVTYGSPIIDIQAVSDQERAADYVARYSARPAYLSDMPIADRIEVITALHGKRLSGTFGNAKCVTLTPPKIESDADWIQLGQWDVVVSDSATNLCAKAILHAWKMNTPLAECDAIAYAPKNDKCDFEIPCPRVDRQIYMDFYNTS